MGTAIAFYFISACILGFAVMVISTKDTVHSVLFLVLEPHGVMGLVSRVWRAISRRLSGSTHASPAAPAAPTPTVEESTA